MIIPIIGFVVSITFLLFFASKIEDPFGQFIIVILSAIVLHVFLFLDSHFIGERRTK